MKRKYVSLKGLIISAFISLIVTPGFLFYFSPIRNVSSVTIILTIILLSMLFMSCTTKFIFTPYNDFSRKKKSIIASFYLLFSLLLLISSKGPQLYLNDNHPLIVIYVYIATFLVMLILTMTIGSILLLLTSDSSLSKISRWKILIYALPHMIIWSIYLIAFYPAVMSIDSMQQWDQAHVPYFHDWHPVPHTWFIMLATSVWDSPAGVAAAQLIILSLIFGYIAYCFEKYGVSKIVIYLMLLITAFIPVTGIYSVNLWKDVMFSASILLFSMYLIHLILSNGKWMSNKTNMVFFTLASFGVVFFRHNGFPVFVATLILLFIVFRLKLLRTYCISAFIIAMYFFIRGPVYDYLDVIPASQNEALAIPTQQIAAVIKENGELTEKQSDFIEEILPIEVWKQKYNPYIVDPLKFDEHYNGEFIQKNKKEYFQVWLELIKHNPAIVTNAYLKESSLVWQIHHEPGTYFLPFLLSSHPPEMAIQRGIQHQIINQPLTAKAQSALTKTLQQPFYWMWRPALFSFSLILFGFILIIKGRWKLILAAAPVMLNTAAVAISLPAQDFRYLYANFLVAFLMFLASCLDGKKKTNLIKGNENAKLY